MNKYWKSQFEHWTTVQAKTLEEQRRGHLLALFLLIFITFGIVIALLDAWDWLVNGNIVSGRFTLTTLLEVGIFAGMWQLNRRGHTTLIAHLLLNLIIVAMSFISETAFLSAVFIAYAIPTITAGFVLRPQWSFPYAALAALGYMLRFQFADVSIPLFSDKQIAILFGLAAVTYLIASRYQDAFERAHQALEERERAEDALKASEKRFRAIIEHGTDQVALVAPDGTQLYENPTTASPLGYPLGAFLGRNLFELVHPDDLVRARQTWEEALDQPGLSLQAAFRLRHADGSWRWMEGTATNLLAEPSVRAVVINYRDITKRKQAETALHESEARYRMLINIARDLIFTLDMDGKITSLNPWFETFIGWSRADWLGRSFEELIAMDDRSRALDQVHGLLHGATLHAIRLRVPTRAGETLILDLNMSPQFKEGRVVGILGIARDITEKQRAEDALKASEKHFRSLIENSSDAISLISAEGTILYESPSVYRVLGYSPEELVGRNVFELLHPDDLPEIMPLFSQILQQPDQVVTAGARYRHKDGSWLWIEGTGRNLIAEPSVQAIVVNYRDITERKRAEEELQAGEARLRLILETALDGFITIDAKGVIVEWNPQAEAIFGWPRAEAVGQYLADLIIPESYRADHWRGLQHYRVTGEGPLLDKRIEIVGLHRAGHSFPIELTITTVPSAAGLTFSAFIRDITERKQAEANLREAEAKYRSLVEHIPAITYMAALDDPKTRLYVSPQIETYLGVSPGEYLADADLWRRLIHPQDRERVLAEAARFYASGEPFVSEYRTLTRDGRTLWFHDEALIVKDETGQPRFIQGVKVDITERKQAEEALRQRESILEAAANNAELLLKAPDWRTEINTVLKQLGQTINASHAYLFENHKGPNGETVTSIRFEWDAPSFTSDLDNPIFKNVPLREVGFESWYDAMSRRQPYIGDKRIFTPVEMDFFSSRGIKALLEMPIYINDQWWGIIGFDDTMQEREWSKAEADAMIIAANILSAAIQRGQAEEKLQRQNQRLKVLREIDTAILAADSVENIVGAALSHIRELIECRRASMALIDWGTSEALIFDVRMIGETSIPQGMRFPLALFQDMDMIQILSKNEPVLINDLSALAHPPPQIQSSIKEGFRSVCILPLFSQSNLIGTFNMSSEIIGFFDEEKINLGREVANQVAIAIQNARLFESEQQHREEAAAIADVGRDISASLQLDVVLEKIAAHAISLLRVETSAVYLAEPATSTLRAVVAIGPDAEEIKKDALEIGEGVLGNIALQKSGEIANDTAAHPRAVTIKGTEITPLEHLMGVPVLSKNQLIGLIAVWRIGAGQEFKSTELDFLSSLAGQVAVAIENARLFEETKQRLRDMQGLAQIGEAISQNTELEPLLTQILDAACETIPAADKGSILLLEDHDALRIYALSGYTDPRTRAVRFSTDAGYAALAVREKRGVLVPDALADASITFSNDIPEMNEVQSAMVAPLIVKQRVIGTISLDNASRKSAFTEDDLRLLVALATPAALAIENARLFKETRRRLADLEILQTISTALRVAKTLDEALPIILDQLINLLDVGSALLDILDPSNGEIVTELAHGVWAPITGMRTPRNVGVSGHVISTGQPYITTDLVADGLVVRPDLVGGLNAAACVPIIAQHQPIGALWVGRKTAITKEEVTLLTTLGEMVGNTIRRMSLHEQTERLLEDLQASNMELTQAYDTTLEGWAKALELRDKETEGHSRRVTELTLQLARYIGIHESEMPNIHHGVLLHDIGKMGVPDQVLKKTGPLSDEDWVEMRKHPQYAYDLLYPIMYLRPALDIPYCHHEHWDGSGYPRGLKGNAIPLPARIFAVVDVWDALTNDRPYRKAWTKEKTVAYIKEQSGVYFDPRVVEKFLEMIDREYARV